MIVDFVDTNKSLTRSNTHEDPIALVTSILESPTEKAIASVFILGPRSGARDLTVVPSFLHVRHVYDTQTKIERRFSIAESDASSYMSPMTILFYSKGGLEMHLFSTCTGGQVSQVFSIVGSKIDCGIF